MDSINCKKLVDNIDDILDIVLRPEDEDAKKIGVVAHGEDIIFRIDKLK